MPSSPGGPSPRVGVRVEPRLLRDAIVAALERAGVELVDVGDGVGGCDVLLASEVDDGDGAVGLVIAVGEAGSREAGVLSVADLLSAIEGWRPRAV